MFARSFLLAFVVHCLLLVRVDADGMDVKVKNKCLEEHQLTAEEVDILKEEENPPEKFKCFVKCMLTGFNVMNEAGDITGEEVPEHLSNEGQYFSECKDVTGTDICDKAFNFKMCVMERRNEHEGTPV